MMKADPRVKMLNLIRVSIKMNNNERTRVRIFSRYTSLNEISKAYHLQLVTQHFVSQNLL